jgi:hypothetical protein
MVVGNHGVSTTTFMNIALINSIVDGNSGGAPSDIYFSVDYSRLEVNEKNYVNSVSALAGTTPVFNFNSGNSTLGLAASPANNGGSIETMLLDNTSTLVNVGTNNVSGYSIPVKDARNYSRTDAGVDIGAYERAGIVDDATPPAITYTALSNTPSTSNVVFTATITDANGVYPWTNLVPRVYFKKNAGGTWQSTTGSLTSGTGRSGTWTFTIDNSLMGGVVGGDQIYYYVIAQDVSSVPSIVSNPAGVTATDVNTVSAAPGTPNSYLIGSACNAPTVPTVSASPSTICAGANTTLSIASGSLNDATDWKWYTGSCGGTAAGTGTSITVSPAPGTTYYVRGEGGCVTPGSCANISVTVNPAVTPAVTISSSDADNKICAGTSVTFTPAPTNGGASPTYQWKVNNSNVATGATYTTTTLANNDVVTVVLTSNATCASPTTATSAGITTTVDPVLVPSVSITSSDADNKICAGTSVTFTPAPTNGGASPSYQWKLNNSNVATGATYTTATLANNDVVTVVLTSNATCASPATATSTGITTTVDPILVPSVSIVSNDADNEICAGTSVTFTATPVNGGATPGYQWKLNGSNVSTSATYTTTTLANNDEVTLVMTSTALCASPATATSNLIKMKVNPVLTPSVTITSNDADNKICAGTSVTFTPTPLNGGTTPTYQWKINNSNVATGATYTTTTLANTNVVTVVMTSNAVCASPVTATSTGITMTVDPVLVPSVSIASSDADNEICAGASVTFTPTPVNGGTTPAYQWKLNGSNISTSATYITTALANDDEVTVVLTSNALCASPATATSNGIKTKVNPVLTPAVTITSDDADNTICSGKSVLFTPTPVNGGATPAYQWKLNGNNVATTATYSNNTLADNDVVSVLMTSSYSCASTTTATSNNITMKVNQPTSATLTKIACDSYVFNSQTYTTSGIYTITLTNAKGCDSVVTLNLTINKSSTSTTSKTACDSYIWNSQTYTTSGTYTQTFVNAIGCDSIATLNLTINKSSAYTLTKTGCDSLFFDNKKYTTSGTYTVVLTNKKGCDSTVTLQFTINKSNGSTINKTACDKYLFNSIELTASGVYKDTLMNAGGCDSIVTLNLTINKSNTGSIVKTACDSLRLNNVTYTASGTYTQVLVNHAGCDSVVTLNLTINKSSAYTYVQTACDSIVFNNKKYTQSGTYTDVLKNAAGCDSLVTLQLTIPKSSSYTLSETACDKYVFNSVTYTLSGTYKDTLINKMGCDSIVTLNLTINKSNAYTLVKTACGSFTLNNQVYTTSGTYTQIVTNTAGCDSVITLQLTIKSGSNTNGNVTATACDKYILNNETYTSSGTYTQTLPNAAGCDSIVTLNLTINHSTAYTLNDTSCNQYVLNGQIYTTSGTYTQVLKNAAGCDSVLTLHLIIENLNATVTVTNNIMMADQAGGVYQWLDCNSNNTPVPGATGQLYTATVSGMYSVIVTIGECMDTSACYSVIVTGVDEFTKQSVDVLVYPNPNRGSFTLKSKQAGTFYIVNELGQCISRFELNANNNYTVNVTNVGMGIYFIQGVHSKSVIRHKLVVTE